MKKQTFIATALVISLAACNNTPTADQIQRRAQEVMNLQADSAVGMPTINNFQEKRMLKNILEKRDQAIVTYTYTQDLNAGLHKLCDSIGYGLSASTQYTNPSRVVSGSGGAAIGILPQADPNGLFSPAVAEGSWIMCKNPHGTDVGAVYSEPRIIVSPFPLK